MPSEQELAGFINATFRSVWTLELLLFLKRNGGAWGRPELVQGLRASDSVIVNGIEALAAAGLVIGEDDGTIRYRPASPDLEALAEGTETLYAQRPDAVRRLIVGGTDMGVAAFADAFRLRRD
jgi:hypothetical protein